MINKLPPFKGLNITIHTIIPIKGRGFINHGSTLFRRELKGGRPVLSSFFGRALADTIRTLICYPPYRPCVVYVLRPKASLWETQLGPKNILY